MKTPSSTIIPAFTMFCLLMITGCSQKQPSPSGFSATVEKHLQAIQARNLETLLSTVSDSVTLIFPTGAMLQSKADFSKFHQSWFADSNWVMKPVVVKTNESESMGYALVRYQYSELDSARKEINTRSTYLQLVFRKGEQGWQLIHDQNTRISE